MIFFASIFLCFFFLEHIFPFVIQSFIIVPSSNHASFFFSAANWKLFLVWWQWPRLLLTSHLGKVKYSTELRKEAKKKMRCYRATRKWFSLYFSYFNSVHSLAELPAARRSRPEHYKLKTLLLHVYIANCHWRSNRQNIYQRGIANDKNQHFFDGHTVGVWVHILENLLLRPGARELRRPTNNAR